MKREEIVVKTKKEIKIMAEGGRKLGKIKEKLTETIIEGTNASEIERLAEKLIKSEGGEASFKMVKGYSWATCVNINDGIVHGIPKKDIVFKKGDVVSIDVGFFYKGYHTDTSFSHAIEASDKTKKFLDTGKEALKNAIDKAFPGNRIYDLSEAIEKIIESAGFSPIRALVGHGIGRELHEPPQIPCFVSGERNESPKIPKGAVLAIEVMYTKGRHDVTLSRDGWTIETSDGKIAGLLEETVAVTGNGPLVLTASNAVLTTPDVVLTEPDSATTPLVGV